MTLALILFVLFYILMLAVQQYRPWVALGGAGTFLLLGKLGVYDFTLADAARAVDFNVLLMMAGMMGTVFLFIQSKMPARLAEELIAHYRALMLAALPGGQSLLSGVSPEEEQQYLEKGPQLGQREAVRAIRTLGNALEHMTRGSDQRIELELALFTLSEPPQAAPAAAGSVQAAAPAAPVVRPFVSAPAQSAPQPFVSTPVTLSLIHI
mgnify:CR=1 FL=1